MQNVAPRLSDTPGQVHHVGPELGEHNDYVYGEILEISAERQRKLQEAGVI
jgi:crotonobetainyl-CoA:carnitine CoA-transferase CaiB-like acyl-CoA transferase